MKSKFLLLTVVFVVALGLVCSGIAVAAPAAKAKVETKAQKSRGGGADENIKSTSVSNDPAAAKKAAPASKGGGKSRGAYCHLLVDNSTEWKIQIFVDKEYVGLMQPWGDADGYYDSGTRVFYGVADFTDGSKLTWGPIAPTCDGDYRWRLTP